MITRRLGKMPEGHWIINCNDAGVRFVEGNVEEWLRNVNREKQLQLLHWEEMFHTPYFWSPLYIQVREYYNFWSFSKIRIKSHKHVNMFRHEKSFRTRQGLFGNCMIHNKVNFPSPLDHNESKVLEAGTAIKKCCQGPRRWIMRALWT